MSTATQEVRVRPLGRGTFFGGVLATLAIHLGLAYVIWHASKAEPPPAGEHEVMITKMIKFGKPREKFWLPRITEPPPPKVTEPTIKVSENLDAKPAVKEEKKEKPKDEKLSKSVQDVLNRRRAMLQNADPDTTGDLSGDRNSDANETQQGDPYATEIYNAIRKNWNVPTGLSLGDALNLEAQITVRISEDGTLLEPRLKKSSGSGLYDDACLQAVQTTHRVPPPPPAKRAYWRRGLTLLFDGKSLAH